jgi:hypothetical protein
VFARQLGVDFSGISPGARRDFSGKQSRDQAIFISTSRRAIARQKRRSRALLSGKA